MTEPKILAFLCNWCSYAGSDQAGARKLTYPAGVRLVRVMCSGRVGSEKVLEAFRAGAQGVMILGCHPGSCHYREGNKVALRRTLLLRKLLEQLGIAPERFCIDWVAAGEGERFARLVTQMSDTLARLGPLALHATAEEALLEAAQDAATCEGAA